MNIGRKVYYNKTTGEVVWDKGEMSGGVRETTFEEDKAVMPEIDNPDVAFMELPYGEKIEQFKTCGGFIVDHDTKQVTFLKKIEIPVVDEIAVLREENSILKAEKEA